MRSKSPRHTISVCTVGSYGLFYRYTRIVAERQPAEARADSTRREVGVVSAEQVDLNGGRWQMGGLIGSGGFAKVHEAESPEGESAVLKLVPKHPGAEREVLLEKLTGTPNVIPILDTGEHGDHWVLAMPRAEMSLRDHLERHGRLEPDDARLILVDIANALCALGGHVIHRDLKPENVLFWKGVWCLADFGIARYAEQTTAPDTRKFSMTAAYAAPEQWRYERATGATDVYALGAIAYEMLNGDRPFAGPGPEDFREQHLHDAAPPLKDVPTSLASVVADCLIKPPVARPAASDLLRRLEGGVAPASAAASRLQQVDRKAGQQAAEVAATAEAKRTDAERRRSLFEVAQSVLKPVSDNLRAQLLENVPYAAPSSSHEWPFKLNGASLAWVELKNADETDWEHYPPAFDVIAHAGIELTIPPAPGDYHGRSHSIWYCDAQQPGVFRWYETAFMTSPFLRERTKGNPVMLRPGKDAGGALSNVMTSWQIAWPFTPIDQDGSTDFIERWLGWFADAMEGKLHYPSSMPERAPAGSYRT